MEGQVKQTVVRNRKAIHEVLSRLDEIDDDFCTGAKAMYDWLVGNTDDRPEDVREELLED